MARRPQLVQHRQLAWIRRRALDRGIGGDALAARGALAQAWERSISGRATGKIVIDIG